jgi:hypothetical protein
MTQLGQWGSMALINHISGNATPVIASSAPTWVPGMVWINTSSSPAIYHWNGSSWVPGAASLYIALCTADPATSGPGGGFSVNISDLVEDTTSGYTRQAVTFSVASSTYPAVTANTNNLTFGPYSAGQSIAVQWAALVNVSSGTGGLLLYWWDMSPAQQVAISQEIIIGSGTLTLDEQ